MVLLAKTFSGSMTMDFGIRLRSHGEQRFHLFDFAGEDLQESCPRCAVDNLMIARQRQADRVDDRHASVLAHRLKLDGIHAENRYLRRVENRGETLDTQVSQVADGKSRGPQGI